MSSAAQVNSLSRGSTGSRSIASLQTKLTVGASRDSYEQEADRVAESVVGQISKPAANHEYVRGTQPTHHSRSAASAVPTISRLIHRTPTEQAGFGAEKTGGHPKEDEHQKVRRRSSKDTERERKHEPLQKQEEETETRRKLQAGLEYKNEHTNLTVKERPPEKEKQQQQVKRAEDHRLQTKAESSEHDKKDEERTKVHRQEEGPDESQSKLQLEQETESQGNLQRQGEEEEETQSKAEAHPGARDKQLFPQLDVVEKKLFDAKGGGVPLPEPARIPMEVGMGADFSRVRVHTDPTAVELSRALKAQAFTHGCDVFFNAGKYAPETIRGKLLLAHELTHVVQQQQAERKAPENTTAPHTPGPAQPIKPGTDKAATTEKRSGAEAPSNIGPGLHRGTGDTPSIASGSGEKTVGPATTAAVGLSAGTNMSTAAGSKVSPRESPLEEEPAEAVAKDVEPLPETESPPPGSKVEAMGEALPEEAVPSTKKAAPAVGSFLRRTSKPALEAKKTGIRALAGAQKTTDTAETKLAQTQKAVVPPVQESESRSRAGQVEKVDQAKAPTPSESEAKTRFNSALAQAVPTTLEQVDQFKEEGKAQVVSQAVQGVVAADATEVKNTYQQIENAPPAGPPAPTEDLPATEAAPESSAVDMGEGVVGDVQTEHTDMSEYGAQSDDLLKKEQIKEEHLEMVDEGDLAEARKDRQDVKTKVKDAPATIKQTEREEKQNVRSELRKEEQQGKQAMQEQRRTNLSGARDDQKKTKSAIELKRQQVTEHINGIYEKANSTVKQKLEDLEKKSLADFESGQKQATQTFENDVKRGINAFKKKRYDQVGGGFLWVKDKLLGMDDLPEVKQVFDTGKSAFISAIDALIKNITADNKRVIQECKDIVANSRKEIEKYVQGLGPDLKKTGDEALKEMKGKLDALSQKINEKEEELKKKLQAKREAAIKAIEDKIAKMKEEMSGALAKLGKLLLNAMIKFFEWALKKAGYASDQLMGIINKGKEVIQKIVTDPIGFIKNLVKAVRDGIDLFATNIKKHLIAGLMSWLTGALADMPITLPEKWDLKGILYLILQILGLTWDRIRMKLVKRLGEKVVRIAETTVDIVKRLISEGPMGLWEMLKEKAEEIKAQVMEGVRNWAIVELVKQGIIKLVSFLNPAGAIIQAILAIYNTVMFFVENWQRIVEFVKTTFESIGEIAMGKLSKAAQAVERALGMTVPIILAFLARLLGLSGIGKTVTGIIKKIRKPIDKVVNKVVNFVVKNAKKLVAKVKAGAKALKEKGLALIRWWTKKISFKTRMGAPHKLFYRGKKDRAVLMLASNAEELTKVLKEKAKAAPAEQAIAMTICGEIVKSEQKLKELESAKATAKDTQKKKLQEQAAKENENHYSLLVKLSDALSNIPLESGVALKSEVTFAGDRAKKKVTAKPLTWLPGNTRGSEPSDNPNEYPEGWQHVGIIDPESKNWVRGHLLNEWLHGPGQKRNLTPITQKLNDEMKRGPEAWAKSKIKEKEAILSYMSEITELHSGKHGLARFFPKTIVVTAKRLTTSRSGSLVPGSAGDDNPPAWTFHQDVQEKGEARNINDLGRKNLITLTKVTPRFVIDYWETAKTETNGGFESFEHFAKLVFAQKQGSEKPRKHVKRIQKAVKDGLVKFPNG